MLEHPRTSWDILGCIRISQGVLRISMNPVRTSDDAITSRTSWDQRLFPDAVIINSLPLHVTSFIVQLRGTSYCFIHRAGNNKYILT